MEWCGVTYEVSGAKEQLDRIQEDLQALPRTQAPGGASLCSHKDVIETYFPLDRKESYVGEISFGRIDETRMVINDINNYDGFSLKPALAERYGTLTFRSVMEFSPGGPAAERREYPLETVTPRDARRMRAEGEAKSLIPDGANFRDRVLAEFEVKFGYASDMAVRRRMSLLKEGGNAPAYGFVVYDDAALFYYGPLASEIKRDFCFKKNTKGQDHRLEACTRSGVSGTGEEFYVSPGEFTGKEIRQCVGFIHSLADRKALQKSTRAMLGKLGTEANGENLSKGM